MERKKTKVFHGGKFTAGTVKTDKARALEAKEELQKKGKKVRITKEKVGKDQVSVYRLWTQR
jgi:hypothetical protein